MLRKLLFRIDPGLASEIEALRHENEQLKVALSAARAVDTREIMRKDLALVDLRLQGADNPLKGLKPEEVKVFEMWGNAVKNSQWFPYLLDHMVNRQAAKTLSRSLEDEKAGWVGAGFINGLLSFREEVERLAAAREKRMRGEEPYEQFNMIA